VHVIFQEMKPCAALCDQRITCATSHLEICTRLRTRNRFRPQHGVRDQYFLISPCPALVVIRRAMQYDRDISCAFCARRFSRLARNVHRHYAPLSAEHDELCKLYGAAQVPVVAVVSDSSICGKCLDKALYWKSKQQKTAKRNIGHRPVLETVAGPSVTTTITQDLDAEDACTPLEQSPTRKRHFFNEDSVQSPSSYDIEGSSPSITSKSYSSFPHPAEPQYSHSEKVAVNI